MAKRPLEGIHEFHLLGRSRPEVGFAGKKNPTSGEEVGSVTASFKKSSGSSYTPSRVVAVVSGDITGATKHTTVMTDGAGRHDGFKRHL
jgi:hypothetical protein